MQTGMVTLARWFIISLIVIGLPLLAIPSVARSAKALLYGPDEQHVPVATPREAIDPVVTLQSNEEFAPAVYAEPNESPAPGVYGTRRIQGSRSAFSDDATQTSLTQEIPPEPPAAALPPQPLEVASNAVPLQADWRERVSAVRLQLERWGADYLLLETTGPDRFRFHCRMVLNPGGATKTFEVDASDPAAAAERVLDDVAAWKATLGVRR